MKKLLLLAAMLLSLAVHPNLAGYKVMEIVLMDVLNKN